MSVGPYIAPYLNYNLRVLSLGCGILETEKHVPFKHMVGVDIYKAYLDSMKDKENVIPICHDIRTIKNLFLNNSFDVVLCLDVIEHLEEFEGINLIEDAEDLATKMVIFYTPLKFDTNEKNVSNKNLWSYGNKYNLHKSLWTPKTFTSRGYEVREDYPSKTNPEGFIAIKRF